MRALQVKDEFVSSVSHELRTPLTGVLGYLELLRERDDLPSDVTAQLRVVERNARRLLHLVSDLLHVAQAREGGLELDRDRVDLVALVRHAVEAAMPAATTAGVTLTLGAPASLEAEVDGERIRQVVDNLLSNGIKYTEPGGSVTVDLRLVGRGVQIAVTDTGIGLTAAEQEQVFTRFFRAPEVHERQIPGTGLGLNIVQAIVEAHGGSVTVESEAGVGSTFVVTLPASL